MSIALTRNRKVSSDVRVVVVTVTDTILFHVFLRKGRNNHPLVVSILLPLNLSLVGQIGHHVPDLDILIRSVCAEGEIVARDWNGTGFWDHGTTVNDLIQKEWNGNDLQDLQVTGVSSVRHLDTDTLVVHAAVYVVYTTFVDIHLSEL